MNMSTRIITWSLLSLTLLGCRATAGADSSIQSLVDARVLRKSQINSNFWLVECNNGITETHTTAEVRAERLCESVPLYQFYNPDRGESLYTTSLSAAGPNYGLRAVRFNILPYAMINEDGQPLTQALTHCFNPQTRDHFLSVGRCNSPHESGRFVADLGFVLKPNQAEVGATMQLIRCVRPAQPGLQSETKYAHNGQGCQDRYSQVGSSMGIVLRPFADQIAIGE